jgi:hypothetical protein
MSEAFYRCLLRCYPASFRKEYAEEMMHLFRDRMAHETHALARFRLWAELLCDLAVTLPQQHWRAHTESAAVNAKPVMKAPFACWKMKSPAPGHSLLLPVCASS